MPRSPSPPRSEYSHRHHSRTDYRDREPHYRDRDYYPDGYRDLDRPPEDLYYDRRRSRSRERDRGRDKYDRRERRPRSPHIRDRDRNRDRDRRDRRRTPERSLVQKEDSSNAPESSNSSIKNIDPDEDPEQALMKAMGISGFNTTKGKKVVGNDAAAVSIKKQRQYRQYMNRRGGFNRPLDKIQ